jgi:glutamyl/glutaminyl-tRNA synthetase
MSSEDESGTQDFIVGRTNPQGEEFVPSYQWACAIDDYDGEHALLVRASDLEHVVSQQRQIHGWVGAHEGKPRPYPAVFHTALVLANDGHRLEKRTQGVTWPELQARGITATDLVDRFRGSFHAAQFQGFQPGRIWGEKPETLTLAKLGL